MRQSKIRELFIFIENKPWIVFIFIIILIFSLFHGLFRSFFEADEWIHFTYYLPLAGKQNGFLTSLISTFFYQGFLSGEGQHLNPVGTGIFFLNAKFFGLHFAPYAFMSLLLHSVNSFLIFSLIKTLLYKKEIVQKNIYALLGGFFFALAPTPLHTITGAAAFYSSNILSVTFFLLCIISFKTAFIKMQKKYIYVTILFLFLALFSKETTAFLFFLLPFMVLIEKRVFSLKFFIKLFFLCVIIYSFFRFILPNGYLWYGYFQDKLINTPSDSQYQPQKTIDTGSIASGNLYAIHKNLPAEILFRTITFPVRMAGTLFVPRRTAEVLVKLITPVIVPVASGGDHTGQLGFLYGSGYFVVVYLTSIGILIFCIFQTIDFFKKKQIQEARMLAIGIAIIIFSALPLVAIIFSFPRWGYDSYFDSRHYYNPCVGAAIVFPFLFFGTTKLIAKSLRIRSITTVAFVLYTLWLLYTLQLLSEYTKEYINQYSSDRREVVQQMKKLLPRLAPKTVFYIETDGLSAYGPILPFQTSIPQALSLVYYDKSPLPDSFYNKVILDTKPEGYQYSDGRGFGYYISKKTLADALFANTFSINDIYSFYYDSQRVKVFDRTLLTRSEMKKYLTERKKLSDWKLFERSLSAEETMTFFIPPNSDLIDNPVSTTEADLLQDIQIQNAQFPTQLKVIHVTPSIDITELARVFANMNNAETISKKVFFDTYHANDVLEVLNIHAHYFIKFDDVLITAETNTDKQMLATIEKILGSIVIEKNKTSY